MKVIEHLDRASEPLISFEIIPPLRGGSGQDMLALIDDLAAWKPPFIDITSHAAEAIYEETAEGGFERKVKRKRPGSLGVCALIQHKYEIDAVPHVLCVGFTREETEDFLIELSYLGIDNVLAIRGDDQGFQKPLQYGRSANEYASDLVSQIVAMNTGHYLDENLLNSDPSQFCVGVAGYPEKHFEAPNLDTDIRNIGIKVAAGAEYIVTQMFFDNSYYFDFVAKCREQGINVPIIPGVKILTSRSQVTNIPRNFYCEVPAALADEALGAKPGQVVDVGIEWAAAQSLELMERGAPAVHFYVMQSSEAVGGVMKKLRSTS